MPARIGTTEPAIAGTRAAGTGQGAAVVGAVPVAVGWAVLGAGDPVVGATAGPGAVVTVGDGVGVPVGKGVGAGKRGPVWAGVASGRDVGFVVGCSGVLGSGVGVFVRTGVDVEAGAAVVGGGGSIR